MKWYETKYCLNIFKMATIGISLVLEAGGFLANMNFYAAPVIYLRFSLIREIVQENMSCRLKKVEMASME